MKKLIILFIAIFSFGIVSAQSTTDSTIRMFNTFTGIKFVQNQQEVHRADVYDMLSTNNLSSLYMYKASVNESMSMLLGLGGGFLIGYPLGQKLSGKEPQWEFAGGGILMLLVAAHFNSGYKNNLALAISIYHKQFSNKPASRLKIEMGLNKNGIGMSMRF